MKNTLRYIWMILLVISLVCAAAGCGRGEDSADSGTGEEERQSYVPKYMELDQEISSKIWLYGLKQFGDELYSISYAQGGSYALEKCSLTDGSRESIPLTWVEPGGWHRIAGFSPAQNGGIYVIADEYIRTDAEGPLSSAERLSEFDARGQQLFAVDITEQLTADSGDNVIYNLETDAQGHIYIAGERKVWLYDVQEGAEPVFRGEVEVCSAQDKSRISYMGRGRDGKVYVSCGKEEGWVTSYSLMQIDFDSCRSSRVCEEFPGNGEVVPGIEKDFLVYDNRELYEYDLESQTREPVLNWVESGIDTRGELRFGVLEDGRIYVATREFQSDEWELAVLSRATGEELASEKEEITLGYLYAGLEIQQAVVDFNKSSDRYRIVLKQYEEYDRLLVDLTVNCPDILDLKNLNVEEYAEMGLFEDLGPYMDNSPLLDRSDYLENVLEAYTFDGSLVTIPSSFWIRTIFAGAESIREVFGDDFEGGWTVDELMTYADANPGKELLDGYSGSGIMECMMLYGKESFIDWENGTCSFDSDRFRKVLEFAGRFPAESAPVFGCPPARIEAGEVLLGNEEISRFDGLQVYEEVFGGETVSVGYPTADGSSGCTLRANNALAISARSPHKEGAWAFVESFLANEKYEAANTLNDFVTNKRWLERKAEAARGKYATDENGKTLLDENGKPIRLSYSVLTMSYGNGWSFSTHTPTEEEIQRVYALIETAVGRPDPEKDVILKIINEEADAFFQGQKTAEAVADVIQRRVMLYMEENRK